MNFKPHLPEGFHLIELQTVGSTNDHAKELAKSGYPTGTIVWAHKQTAGRGRQGNKWESLGGNLFMSVILRPPVNAAIAGQMSFVAAVALAEAVEPLLPENVKLNLKWPNDMLLNEKKTAGILIESEAQGVRPASWVVVGIGVNIKDAPEGAESLSGIGIKDVRADHILECVCERLSVLQDAWRKEGFDLIRQKWMGYAWHLGETIKARLPKETVSGVFLGIDKSGELLLGMDDGTKKSISSGEVFR